MTDIHLGVVGSPTIAADLAKQSIHTISADTFEDSASRVAEVIRKGEANAVLIVDNGQDAKDKPVGPWLTYLKGRDVPVLVLTHDTTEGCIEVPEGIESHPTPFDFSSWATTHGFTTVPNSVCIGEQQEAQPSWPPVEHQPDPEPVWPPVPLAQPQPQVVTQLEPEPQPQPQPQPQVVTQLEHQPQVIAQPLPQPQVVSSYAAPGRGGKVIAVFAGKGGVGKSTIALALADFAANHGPQGYRVCLIDANRGQGDISTYLGVDNLPTIYDMVSSGQVTHALLSPNRINALRDPSNPISFAAILAPPDGLADPSVITPAIYKDAITFAQQQSDLVIVDTQIAEAFDEPGLFSEAIVPAVIASKGAVVGVVETSKPSIKNLPSRAQDFIRQGVDPRAVLICVNKTADLESRASRQALNAELDQVGHVCGFIPYIDQLEDATNKARMVSGHPHVAPVLQEILSTTTDIQDFAFARPSTSTAFDAPGRKKKKRGFFRRWL